MKVAITTIILLFFTAINCFSQGKKIAITIDDLPCTHCEDYEEAKIINSKILNSLKTYNVPAIGFVVESRLYTNGKPDHNKILVLEDWIENGFELGNHTFSHPFINNTSLTDYVKDVKKGEIITRPLLKKYNKELKYFRHTQLRTGPTKVYKEALDRELLNLGYTIAPVTIDNDEYIYAYCYHIAKEQKDSVSMRLIAYDYLWYMEQIINHYEKLSVDLMGRHISQILLLHANDLNRDYLSDILRIFKKKNYQFISLDEALTDSAYDQKTGHYSRGLSWLNRWQIEKGLEPTIQPNVSDKIMKMRDFYSNKPNTSYNAQTFIGNEREIKKILENIKQFSALYLARDYEGLSNSYTKDGKIFPNNAGIIEGKLAIKKRWIVPANQTIKKHIITPVEIKITDNYAYDYGYYEGETLYKNGTITPWKGKYVIIWKKVNDNWKIYLDIWNRL